MKRIILSSVCLVITFLFASGLVANGQCRPSPQAWLDEIKSIENSDAANLEKISGLLSLKFLYQKCSVQHDSVYAVLIHRLGNFYMRQNAYEEAIQYTKEAVSINNSHTPVAQRSFLAHSYFNLALIYDRINLKADSRKYFDSCIQVSSRYPEKTFIALFAFHEQAFSFFQSGDYQKCIDNADKGIMIAVREKDV
jgi:tetratricopeptide (TPR) repeat protein